MAIQLNLLQEPAYSLQATDAEQLSKSLYLQLQADIESVWAKPEQDSKIQGALHITVVPRSKKIYRGLREERTMLRPQTTQKLIRAIRAHDASEVFQVHTSGYDPKSNLIEINLMPRSESIA